MDAGSGHEFAVASDIQANVSVQILSLGLQWQGMIPPPPLLLIVCGWEPDPGANYPPAGIQERDTWSKVFLLT